MRRLRVSAIAIALTILFSVGGAAAQGRRDAAVPNGHPAVPNGHSVVPNGPDRDAVEMTVRAADGGDVVEGAAVTVNGQVTRVGNEPFVSTVVRTAAPRNPTGGDDSRPVWVIELIGEPVEEIERSYQEQVVVLEGILEALPTGVSYGRLRVESVSLPLGARPSGRDTSAATPPRRRSTTIVHDRRANDSPHRSLRIR